MLSKFHENRFLYLLLSIFLLFLLSPVASMLGMTITLFFMDVAFTIVFISAVYAVGQNRRRLVVGIALLLPSMILTWINPLNTSTTLHLFANLFSLFFFGFIIYSITAHVLRINEVTLEQISGTLCVYMLIGMIWSVAYQMIDMIFPGSFSMENMLFPDYNYFSFVTLTTLGYGDISPISKVARAFAMVEAVTGQFFLAVLVARQVGLFIANENR
jgi:hypothetical protein